MRSFSLSISLSLSLALSLSLWLIPADNTNSLLGTLEIVYTTGSMEYIARLSHYLSDQPYPPWITSHLPYPPSQTYNYLHTHVHSTKLSTNSPTQQLSTPLSNTTLQHHSLTPHHHSPTQLSNTTLHITTKPSIHLPTPEPTQLTHTHPPHEIVHPQQHPPS